MLLNKRFGWGKPGGTFSLPHFGRDFACILAPHPGLPLA